MPPRTSYRPVPVPQNARWGGGPVPVSPPREGNPPYARDYHRGHHDTRNHMPDTVSYDMATGVGTSSRHRRRSTEDATYPRERERDTARTRSHDRVKDEWDDRDSSRERDKKGDWDERDRYDRSREESRERDGGRRMHRYVPETVQGGVSGRRYPVPSSGPY